MAGYLGWGFVCCCCWMLRLGVFGTHDVLQAGRNELLGTQRTAASSSMQQFLSAVKYCHSHCVAHRDLKLDNTLLDRCERVGGGELVPAGWGKGVR